MKKSDIEKSEQEKKSKKIKNTISYIFFHSCAYFTIIMLFMLIVQAISSTASEPQIIDPARFIMLYPLSLSIAAANTLFKIRSLELAIKLLLHFTITLASFYIFIQATVAVLLVIAVIYIIVAAIILAVKKIKKKKDAKPTEYTAVFSKDTGKKQ